MVKRPDTFPPLSDSLLIPGAKAASLCRSRGEESATPWRKLTPALQLLGWTNSTSTSSSRRKLFVRWGRSFRFPSYRRGRLICGRTHARRSTASMLTTVGRRRSVHGGGEEEEAGGHTEPFPRRRRSQGEGGQVRRDQLPELDPLFTRELFISWGWKKRKKVHLLNTIFFVLCRHPLQSNG